MCRNVTNFKRWWCVVQNVLYAFLLVICIGVWVWGHKNENSIRLMLDEFEHAKKKVQKVLIMFANNFSFSWFQVQPYNKYYN